MLTEISYNIIQCFFLLSSGKRQGRNEFVMRLQPSEAIYMKLTVCELMTLLLCIIVNKFTTDELTTNPSSWASPVFEGMADVSTSDFDGLLSQSHLSILLKSSKLLLKIIVHLSPLHKHAYFNRMLFIYGFINKLCPLRPR